MKYVAISLPLLLVPCVTGMASANAEPALKQIAVPFSVREVKLLDGPFLHAQDLDAKWLLTIEPDRMLSWFRKEAKLEPQGDVYGGWESMGVAGHSLGHYLSACARMYHATGQEEFKRRVDYIVGELAKCQRAGKDGYVGAIPRGREVFAEVAQGNIRSEGFDLNGSWVPWYTMHKLFAGLIDSYYVCDNDQAKDIAIKLADWANETTKNLNTEQWQKMLACEHGGMNESLAEIYAITGNEKYLNLAEKFYHEAVLDPLVDGKDSLAGKHANTQVPKAIGAARIAELTGDRKFAKIARSFWDVMVRSHTYVTGGNSFGEYLGEPGRLNDRLGDNTTETCNTYNMLKLTSALFADDPKAAYSDYAERALWNHILASQSSKTGMVCYYVPLRAGATKPFQGPEAFTCCSGTGMENHARYGEYIYSHSPDSLWVNQFISSELNWQEKAVSIKQITRLPEEGSTRITLRCKAPEEFTIFLRHPHWVKSGFRVTVNGNEVTPSGEPSSYVGITRTWKSEDVIEVETPLSLRLESMPDNPRRVAVFYGPIVLAGELGGNGDDLLPVLVTNDRPVSQWLKRIEGQLAFRTFGVGRPKEQTLVPFFSIPGDTRYVVYWDIFSEEDWQKRQHDYEVERTRERLLAASTSDYLAIGEMQPERDHNVQGEKTCPRREPQLRGRLGTFGKLGSRTPTT